MAETIGKITNIKVSSFLPSASNAFDICYVTVIEAITNVSWLFLLWNARDDDSPVHRVTQSQRLALVREAAFRNLTVHIFAERISSGLVDGLQVDMP